MSATGTGSLIFTDDATADGSSKLNSEVYRNILASQVQANASKLNGWHFILQQDDDAKHCATATKEFFKSKKWTILDWPSQSPDLNPIEPFIC
ncbi:hypothetical protein LDENG_00224630 [Lucifuga dentata]|nr:hypothetical protein LDENG_00224630 [Lucifuga dentata]